MGHIHKRTQAGTIRWRARYQAPDGSERSRSFVRKADAERFLAEVEADKARGTWTDPALAQITFADWSDQWLRTTTHLKPKTRAGYESTLRTHLLPAFGPVAIGKIRGSHVREVLAGMQARGLSASACRQAYYLLNSILQAAIDDGRIRTSPCAGIKLPRLPNVEMQFLDPSQLRDVLEAIDPRYRLFVELLAISGLRFGEGAALRRCRCDIERSRITVAENAVDVGGKLVFGSPKTHQVRTVVLPSFLSDHLAEQLASAGGPNTLVFTSPRGEPIRYGNFLRRVWKPTLEKVEIPEMGVHALRHTCAALLIAQGAHPKAIQRHLGHRSITTTLDRYGHLFEDEHDRLADRIDDAYRSFAAPQGRSEEADVHLRPPSRLP